MRASAVLTAAEYWTPPPETSGKWTEGDYESNRRYWSAATPLWENHKAIITELFEMKAVKTNKRISISYGDSYYIYSTDDPRQAAQWFLEDIGSATV